jgi:hypothetical protein
MNPFFGELSRRLAVGAKDRGVEIEAPESDSQVAFELLELAGSRPTPRRGALRRSPASLPASPSSGCAPADPL